MRLTGYSLAILSIDQQRHCTAMSSLLFPAVRLLSALIKQKLEQMLFVMDG